MNEPVLMDVPQMQEAARLGAFVEFVGGSLTTADAADRTPGDGATYSEADLAAKLVDGKWLFTHKDASPYE